MTKPLNITTILIIWLSTLTITPVIAKDTFVVAFAQDTMANDWRSAQVMEVKRALSKHPEITFIYTNAKGSTALQALHIEELADKKVDVLITSPRDSATLSPVISKAFKKGIPIILLSRSVTGSDYTTFIHPDNKAIAKKAANYLVKQLDGEGHILMIEGIPTSSTATIRSNEFLNITRDYSKIRVTRIVGNYLRSDTIHSMEQLIERGEKFDAIYSQSDSMAAGARMVLERHGIDPSSIPTVGIDFISEAKAAIIDGKQRASFTYPTGGTRGAEIAIDIIQHKKVPKEIVIESIMVTIDNAETVEPIF